MTISTVTTIKASRQETLSFVSYHLSSGIDHMYLFFDDPGDAAICDLDSNPSVTCIRCDPAHWARWGLDRDPAIQKKQKANATYALQLAREAGADWLVHLDSDELLYSEQSLEKVFSSASAETDVLLFPVMEAVPQRLCYDRPYEEISLFKRYVPVGAGEESFSVRWLDRVRHSVRSRIWYRKKQLATLLGCQHTNLTGHYILGHTAGKSATRTSARVHGIKNHIPMPERRGDLSMSIATKGALLHFDCRGYESWKAKWEHRIDGSANFETGRFASHRKRQMRLFQTAREKGGEAALVDLYKQWYIMSDYEKSVLTALGLVKRVDLSSLLFRWDGS